MVEPKILSPPLVACENDRIISSAPFSLRSAPANGASDTVRGSCVRADMGLDSWASVLCDPALARDTFGVSRRGRTIERSEDKMVAGLSSTAAGTSSLVERGAPIENDTGVSPRLRGAGPPENENGVRPCLRGAVPPELNDEMKINGRALLRRAENRKNGPLQNSERLCLRLTKNTKRKNSEMNDAEQLPQKKALEL